MRKMQRFDFEQPLPMPATAARLVASARDAAPRVGLLLGAAAGRLVDVQCTALRRAAIVELTTGNDIWAPLDCGLPGTCLLLVPAPDAVALADLVMGGTGISEQRPVTALEQQLVLRQLVAALRPIGDALADWGMGELLAGPVSDEPLPVGTGEVVAVVLNADLPAGGTARISLCLPARSLLPAEPDAGLPAPETATERALGDVPVTVALRLPSTTVAAVDVHELAPGDVLRLDPHATDSLTGCLVGSTGDLPVLRAALGSRGRSRAIVIHDLLGGS